MKIITIIFSLLIIVVLSTRFACQYIEEPYRFYETHTDELYMGNWVPKIFPKDITNVHEQHDIDTNEVWVRFDKGAEPVSTHIMKKLSNAEIYNLKLSKPFLASWWFDGLVEQRPANDAALYADVFRGSCGENMESFLAISRTNTNVYWWCQYQ